MSERINKLYKPKELQAAIEAVQRNMWHSFDHSEAVSLVMALHKIGWRVVYVGKVGEK